LSDAIEFIYCRHFQRFRITTFIVYRRRLLAAIAYLGTPILLLPIYAAITPPKIFIIRHIDASIVFIDYLRCPLHTLPHITAISLHFILHYAIDLDIDMMYISYIVIFTLTPLHADAIG